MPLFGSGRGCPLPNPLSPIHADPVARAIGPGANRKPSSRRPVGVAPDPSAPNHDAVASGLPLTRLPRRHAPTTPKGARHEPADPRCRRLPVDPVGPDAAAVACAGRRLSVAPGCPRTRSEMAGEHCPAPLPLSVVAGVGWTSCRSRKPPPHRPGALALFGTMLSKDAAKPQVKRYFRNHRVIPGTFPLPPGFLPSSTRCPPFMHRDVHKPNALER